MQQDERGSSPSTKLSVVVGSVESSRSIDRCLAAIRLTCEGLVAEIFVVNAGSDDTVAAFTSKLANARLVTLPANTLTPELWSEGIALSSGTVIALTTGHCIVSAGWARALLDSIDGGASAAGGPLRLAEDASQVDAAIFFLRYSTFLEGRPDEAVSDIAGDNAAYRRTSIPDGSWQRETGFWENDVNRAIIDGGGSIAWRDAAVAEFSHSFTLGTICRHRFAHGRLFGATRVSDRGESALRIIVGAPLVPFILVVRIARRVLRVPRYRGRFILALPLVLTLAAFWASGEAVGALDGLFANRS